MNTHLWRGPSMRRCISQFIPRYQFPEYNIPLSDFKGHQVKALKKFQDLSPQLNMIIELRDLRAPLSTRNVLFDKLFVNRNERIKRIIVYTKKDFMPHQKDIMEKLNKWHGEFNESFMVLDSKNMNDAKNLMKVIEWESTKLSQSGVPLPMGYRILVTGMPNVGKSTLVNSLRYINFGKTSENSKKTKVSKTGNEAGVTRKTSEIIRISKREAQQGIYLIDSPGVGLPGRVSDQRRMIAQALCSCVKETLIDPVAQADYLLFLMNLQQQRNSVMWYPNSKKNPTNDIYDVLSRVCDLKRTSETTAAIGWINKWKRTGKDLLFDPEVLLDEESFSYKKFVLEDVKKLGDMEFKNTQNKVMGSSKQLFL